MPRVVVLDAGPLGLASNGRRDADAAACRARLAELGAAGVRLVIPEVADFEVRRELIRAGATEGVLRLDALAASYTYAPITTDAMRLAARLWAEARRRGRPGAHDRNLDADVIIAAQAYLAAGPGESLTVATTDPRHFRLFVAAEPWASIT